MKRITTGSTLDRGDHWWLALVCGLLLALIGAGLPGARSSAQAHDFGGGTNPNPPPTDPPPPPPCKERCCNQGTGKPVSWLDGAERLREIDLQVAGIYPIILTRGYDSASLYDTPLGYGWAFTHDRRLFEYPDGSIVIRHGCGQRDRYIQTGGSYVTPTTGVRGRLTAPADGSFVFTYFKESAGNVLPQLQQRFGYDAKGNQSDVWDAKGNLTHTDYDALGRVIAVTNALGEQTLYTYTGDNLTQVEVGHTVADGEGQVTKLIYDGRHNLIETQRKDDNGDFITFQTFTYDSDGNRLTETDAEGRTTSSGFNALGRPVSTTDALGNSTLFAYDATGNLVTLTDAKSRQTRYTYDDLNRLIRTEQLGINPSAVTARIYDAAGNLTGVTDPEGNTTEFTYDALSRKTAEIKPLGQTLRYAYDSRNRLDTQVTARGYRIKYSYAPWGSATREDVFNPCNSGTTPDSSMLSGYDLAGNLASSAYDDIQPLSKPLYSISYDALNRPDQTTVGYIPNKSVTLDNHYNRYGNRSILTVNDGETLTHNYRFDKLNRLVGATLPVGQSVTLDYYATDERKTIAYPSGVATTYTYYANGPVKDITVKNSANVVLEPLAYTYDQVLNVDTMIDSDGVHDYGYDGFDRLTEAKHPSGVGLPALESFDYDRVGNREDPVDPEGYDYDANNRIVASPELTYIFDDDGNQTGRSGGTTLVFNGLNRLSTYLQGGTTVSSYKYDPMGRRVKKVVGAQTVWYLWDGDSLFAEYGGTGNRVQRYAYLPGDYLPAQTQDDHVTYTAHGDHLQTPRVLTDESEQAAWKMRLEAFGKAVVSGDIDGDGVTLAFNQRFPGQYTDKETGLHYNYLRDYDPEVGRYVQTDPIVFAGSTNNYAYVEGNPLSYTDPLGLHKGNKWYGFNNREFQRWFHQCWKQPGNPDADKEEIAEAYAEWVMRGSPTGGKCGNNPPPVPVPAPAPVPVPSDACGDSCKERVATVVVVGGTAYVIYRCLRMIPSLFPPLWPTIPANAVLP